MQVSKALLIATALTGLLAENTCNHGAGGADGADQCGEGGQDANAEVCRGERQQQQLLQLERDHAFIQVRGSIASKAGAATATATACSAAGWCATGMPMDSADAVFLGSHIGNRISLNDAKVDASGSHRERWEVFELLKAKLNGDTGIYSGDRVNLRGHNGKFLSVKGAEVFDQFRHALVWETFTLIRKAGRGRLLSGESIYLIAHTGKRLSVLEDGSVVALWENNKAWEEFSVQKVIPPWQLPPVGGPAPPPVQHETPPPPPTPLPPVTAEPPTQPPLEGTHWTSHPAGVCDVNLGCHRPMRVVCLDEKNHYLEDRHCRAESRPAELEKCLIIGQGSCVNVAHSDCTDVAGCWWNRWRMSCTQLSEAGGCTGGAKALEHLSGWRAEDREYIRSVCHASCRRCDPGARPPPKAVPCGCEDDPMYKGPNNWRCAEFAGAVIDCESFDFADDLKAACPRACGVCG